jgi:hypothetical protein
VIAPNVVAWLLQTSLLILVASLSTRALRLRNPRLEMHALQCILAATILIPWVQPWVKRPAPIPVFRSIANPVAIDVEVRTAPHVPVPDTSLDVDTLMLAIFTAGACLRLVWLLLGIVRLQSYRRTGCPIPPDFTAENLIGTAAEFRVCPGIASPATFGLWRAVVLVPKTFLDMPVAQRHAIACHELLHVKRRDWLACIAEEAALTLMWFHPGVWLLIRRIRTLRERVVDADAVALTRDRQQYIDALLAFAMSTGGTRNATASLFIRQRDLVHRIANLMEESAMSKARMLVSVSLIAAFNATAALFAISTFPLIGAPQPTNGAISRVDVHGVPAEVLPQLEKLAATVQGKSFNSSLMASVKSDLQNVHPKLVARWLEETPGVFSLSIDFLGEKRAATTVVTAIDVSRLPERLRIRVHESLLSFINQPFSNAVLDGVTSVVASVDPKIAVRWAFHNAGAMSLMLVYDLPEGAWQPVFGVLTRVDTSRLSPELRSQADAAVSRYINQPLTNASLQEIGSAVKRANRELRLSWKFPVDEAVTLAVLHESELPPPPVSPSN